MSTCTTNAIANTCTELNCRNIYTSGFGSMYIIYAYICTNKDKDNDTELICIYVRSYV